MSQTWVSIVTSPEGAGRKRLDESLVDNGNLVRLEFWESGWNYRRKAHGYWQLHLHSTIYNENYDPHLEWQGHFLGRELDYDDNPRQLEARKRGQRPVFVTAGGKSWAVFAIDEPVVIDGKHYKWTGNSREVSPVPAWVDDPSCYCPGWTIYEYETLEDRPPEVYR